MRPTVLLLEDDPAIAATVVFAFEREGFAVHHVLLARDADADARRQAPAAAVLDVGVPDGTGLDLCRRWRGDTSPRVAALPVLLLTARSDEIDKLLGLEAGADDYLTKPFSPRELVARVRALLRRAAMPRGQAAAPGFEVDDAAQRIRYRGTALELTRLEHALLRELLRRPGQIVARDALFARVWGEQSDSADRTVDTHIKTLRAKLRAVQGGIDPIVTHRGLGYRIDDAGA